MAGKKPAENRAAGADWKGQTMKRTLFLHLAALLAAGSQAAPLRITNADVSAVHCAFDVNCTNLGRVRASQFILPRATGTGLLETRVLTGQSGSPAAGLVGYLYRLDLSGVNGGQTNQPPSFSNVVRSVNNFAIAVSNAVVCRTNLTGASTIVFCSTNIIPETNITFCYTNFIPETNFVRCFTNAGGEVLCLTNTFRATNLVFCTTKRISKKRFIVCQTNTTGGTALTVCVTNQVRFLSNTVTSVTNVVRVGEEDTSIESLTIPFGTPVAQVDFQPGGTNGSQCFVVTNGLSNIPQVSAEQNEAFITFHFSPPVSAGDSNLVIGLISTEHAGDAEVDLGIGNGSNLVVKARGPKIDLEAIDCDFDELRGTIEDLSLRYFVGADDAARKIVRQAVRDLADAAKDAGKAGDLNSVLEALAAIMVRADGDADDWLVGKGVVHVNREIAELLECLEEFASSRPDGDDDDDDH